MPNLGNPLLSAVVADVYTDICYSRRSTRAFLNDAVPDALLLQLLQCARQAPSGANLQPGSFLRVQGPAR
jgi:nitroreductase